ncbi:MAG: hypothetical protein LM568_03115 [Desulfurococcaceae archaeon]|nr:hypothetical protein [Desulfurococcaceae archaeon]
MGRFWRALAIFEVAVLLFVAMLSYIVVEGQVVTRFAYEFSDFRSMAVYATDRYIVLAGAGGGPAVVVINRTSGLVVSSWYISADDPNSCDIAFDGSYIYVGCVRYGSYIFLGKYSYPGLGVVWEKWLSGLAYSVIDVYAASGNMYFVLNAFGGGASVLAGYVSSDGSTVMVRELAPSGVTDVVMLSGIVGYSNDLVGLCGFLRYTSGGTTYNNLFYLEIYIGSGTVTKNVVVRVPSVPSDGYSFVEAWLDPGTNKVIFSVGRYVAVFDTSTAMFDKVSYIGISGASYYFDSDIEIYGGYLYLLIRYYNTSIPGYMLGLAKLDVGGSIYAGYGYSGTYSFFNDFAVYSDNIAVAGSTYSPYFVFYAPIGVGIPGKVTASPITVSLTSVSYSYVSLSFSSVQPSVSISSVSSSAKSYTYSYIFLEVEVTSTVTSTVTETVTNTVTTTSMVTETATVTNTVTTTSTVTTTAVHAVPYPYTVTETVTTTVTAGPAVDIYVVVFIVAALIAVAVVYSYICRRR